MNIETLVGDRAKQYGNFYDNARAIQALKDATFECCTHDWTKLQPDVKQAIEMICTKLGRILTGNPSNIDTWEDIAGYAVLVADRIKKDQEWAMQAKPAPSAKAGAQVVR